MDDRRAESRRREGALASPRPRGRTSELRALLDVASEAIGLVGADGALLAASASFSARLRGGRGRRPARLDDAIGREAWRALRRALDDDPPTLAPAAPARTVRLAVELPTQAGPRRFELCARRAAATAGGAIAVALRELEAEPAARGAAPPAEPVGPLARSALHELANLLVSIQFASEALLAEEAAPAEAREDLAGIREAAERAGAVLAGLRPRAAAAVGATIDLGAAVSACAPLLARLRPPHAVCTVTVLDAPLPVHAPRERIEQLLAQLVLPAEPDAQAAGALELRVGLAARPDRAGAHGAHGGSVARRAAIALRDGGADPAALLARLAAGGGSGLAAARDLVEGELGGELAIEAAPEGGALVTVSLPLASGDAPG